MNKYNRIENITNETIAFVRLKCLSTQILSTINYIMNHLGDSKINSDICKEIKIDFVQKSDANFKLIKNLKGLFRDNLSTGEIICDKINLTTKSYFFYQAQNNPNSSRIVIIAKIDSNIEYISHLQYLFLLINYLRSKKINLNIILSPSSTIVNKSKKFDEKDFYKIRVALKLLYHYDFENVKNIFWYFNPTSNNCKRIYANIPTFSEDNHDVGSIFPIFNISPNLYNALCKTCKLTKSRTNTHTIDKDEQILLTWCESESKKFQKEVNEDFRKKIIKFTSQDNYLDTIIFLYVCYAVIKAHKYNSKSKKYEIIVNELNTERLTYLHEICIDFSQGILQLLENIIIHVIKEDNGCGTLSIRLHKENYNDYRLYIYINDLQFNSFENLVEKFINNNQKYSNPYTLELCHFFDGKNSVLEQYLEQVEQIAMHYGLQIFDCIVKEHGGNMRVSSGTITYNNEQKFLESFKYAGTAYEIDFNIKGFKELTINYLDVIFPIKKNELKKYNCYSEVSIREEENNTLIFIFNDYFETIITENKETAINNIKDALIKQCHTTDCLITNLLNITNVCTYEIIAKSIFLYLNSPNAIDNIAIVNLNTKYDVVKLFRQFALFFNRKGNSPFNENKKIYIIDQDGDLDVLISGKNLNDIIDLSVYEKIYGGIDSQMTNIINSISKRNQRSV